MATITVDGAGSPVPRTGRRPGARLRRRNAVIGWTFILPNFLGFATLTLVPVVWLFYMAFTDWDVFGKADLVGLDNFRRMLDDASFHKALTNTVYFAAIHIPLTMAVSLGLALLLNRRLRGVAFFRTAAFFPYITSIVAIAMVWNMLFSPQYGPINQILGFLGVDDPPGWVTSPGWAMPAIVLVQTWRNMGYYMIIYLAGLQTVPPELYEAAKIDGAGQWARFTHVTFPLLSPTTFFIAIMATIGSFQVFGLIYAMTKAGPGTATMVYVYYLWQKAFSAFQLGYASALAWLLFLVIGGLTFFQWKMSDRWVFYQ